MFDAQLKFCVNIEYREGYVGQKHSHPCYEIVYYLDGSGSCVIEGREFSFKKDTFCVICPNRPHIERGVKDTEVLFVGFETPIPIHGLDDGVFNESEFHVLSILNEIKQEFTKPKKFGEHILNILVEKLIIVILRGLDKEYKAERTDIVNDVITYIRCNYTKDINIKKLANYFAYSYDYFRHMFNSQTGMTVKDFILSERINCAKDLLRNTKLKITEIASKCGYRTQSHFARDFKTVTGMTPRDYISQPREKVFGELREYENGEVGRDTDKAVKKT